MDFIDVVILGIIEGLTEFLPISSTGHLIIVTRALGLGESDAEHRALAAFNIMIQGGAILAVVGLFWPRIVDMLAGVVGRNPLGLRLLRNLFIAFLPAAILGILLNDWIKEKLFYTGPVAAALLVGGIVLILLRRWQQKHFHDPASPDRPVAHEYIDLDHLSWQRALIIGFLQCIAMWPGTSRSMMTSIGGMLVGMRPRHAAEFSFLLGLPTLGGACLYEAFQMFVLAPESLPSPSGRGARGEGVLANTGLDIGDILLGSLMAFLAAICAVKWMVNYLSRHGLALFGWYRIALGALILILLWRGWLPEKPIEMEPQIHTDAHR